MLLKIITAIRPINLLVVALTFYVLYQLDIQSREFVSKTFLINIINLKFLTIATILIAAAGYLINDYYDKETDSINKPNRKNNLSKNVILVTYILLNAIALILSFSFTSNSVLTWIFPFSTLLLWLYSYKLKGLPFIGNLSIAVLSATIPLIYFITMNSNNIDCQTPFPQITATAIILTFSALAFFSTFSREIVKDIEDLEGDTATGLKTIPIVLGKTTAKVFTIFFLIITLLILGLLVKEKDYFNFSVTSLITVGLFGFIPLLLAISKTFQGKEKKHFKQAGNLIKIGMFGFLLFIYIHAITI